MKIHFYKNSAGKARVYVDANLADKDQFECDARMSVNAEKSIGIAVPTGTWTSNYKGKTVTSRDRHGVIFFPLSMGFECDV